MLDYDEIITSSGIKVPFVPAIITPKIERPMRNNRYEGGECAALRRILRPGDRVLELGAGVGLLSTVAGLIEGIGSVTTIEANPDLIPLIRETHRLNGVTGVDLRNGVATPTTAPRSTSTCARISGPRRWNRTAAPSPRPSSCAATG